MEDATRTSLPEAVLISITEESHRIEEDTNYSGRSHFIATAGCSKLNLRLGVPATLFAAAAGSAIVDSLPTWLPALGFVATILSALQTFLRPEQRSSEHHAAGAEYVALRNQTRIFRTVDLPVISADDARGRLRELAERRDELNRTSPAIPRRAFEEARSGIEAGESQHAIDSDRDAR